MLAILLSAALAGPAPPEMPPIHRVDLRERCDCGSHLGEHCRWYIEDDFDWRYSGWGPGRTFCRKCLLKSQRRSVESNSTWVPYLLP